jgi:RHS repeat-associated protein
MPNGAYVTNSYDPVGRLLGTALNDSGNTALDAALYGYNAGNQRTAYTNAAGAYVQYAYDPIGQLTNANSSVSGENRGYAYDPAWNLNSRTTNGVPQTFVVNGKNELTSAPSNTLSYDDNGNPTGTYFHGASATLGYDDENRLASVSAGGNTYTFAYDGLGRLRVRSDNGVAVLYIYDGMRVIQERDGNNWPQVSYTRGLDLSGTFEGAGGIGGLLARSHDFTSCNTTVSYWLTNGSGYGIYDLAIWDDYGTYVDGVWVGTGSGDSLWQYSFPGLAGRTYYVSGWSMDYYYIQVFNDIFEGTLDNHGVYFDTQGGVTGTEWGLPLCDGGTSGRWLTHTYYHADGNGNITCLITTNQDVVASYRYDPYGNTLSQSGGLAAVNTYRFSSKEFHAATGLYYYGYRWYDPSLQRWINGDPAGESGFRVLRRTAWDHDSRSAIEALQSMFQGTGGPSSPGSVSWEISNPFAFVRNDPLDYADLLGLSRCPCTMAAPVPDSSPLCDSYGNASYPNGISLKCFCKCAGNSAWAQQVRGCLACAFTDNMDVVAAHNMCYAAAGGLEKSPILTLLLCIEACNSRLEKTRH